MEKLWKQFEERLWHENSYCDFVISEDEESPVEWALLWIAEAFSISATFSTTILASSCSLAIFWINAVVELWGIKLINILAWCT